MSKRSFFKAIVEENTFFFHDMDMYEMVRISNCLRAFLSQLMCYGCELFRSSLFLLQVLLEKGNTLLIAQVGCCVYQAVIVSHFQVFTLATCVEIEHGENGT